MASIIASLLITVFFSLAGLHFYWAFGGRWGLDAAIPTDDNNITMMKPGVPATLFVAFGLVFLGVIVLMCSIDFTSPNWLALIHKYGLYVISALFLLRAIGDFKYFGLFKKHHKTKFGFYDTKYYTPLCLLISLFVLILEFIR